LKADDKPLKSEKDNSKETSLDGSKKPWQRMKLTYTGEAKDVVQGGGGKISTSPADPGEARKPTGHFG